MKKLFAIILCAALVCLCFAGCGNRSSYDSAEVI